jgi:hypothetical protein
MTADLTEILRRLPRLAPSELEKVAGRLTALRGTASVKADNAPDWLLDGIIIELRRRGVIGPTARPGLAQMRAFAPDYVNQSEEVRAGLLQGIRYKPRPPELSQLGAFAARALADDLEGGPAPVCLEVMVRNLPKMLGAVDNCFPGYLGCGLLGHLMRLK